MDGITTVYVDINKGRPQETVIGPFLFSLMVNDIKPKKPDINSSVEFADDMTLSAPVKANSDPAETEVRNIENWSRRKRMTLNLEKTLEILLSGRTSKIPPVPIRGIQRKK